AAPEPARIAHACPSPPAGKPRHRIKSADKWCFPRCRIESARAGQRQVDTPRPSPANLTGTSSRSDSPGIRTVHDGNRAAQAGEREEFSELSGPAFGTRTVSNSTMRQSLIVIGTGHLLVVDSEHSPSPLAVAVAKGQIKSQTKSQRPQTRGVT